MIIGIVSHESTKQFRPALLKSLKGCKYPFYTIGGAHNDTNGFELGTLKALVEGLPNEDDFFLLHETTVIKDHSIFDIAAQFPGSLAICPGFGSFMGKYRREILEQVGIPVPGTLKAAIYYEYFWNIMYMDMEPNMASCDEPLVDTDKFVMKFGKKRMLLENRYMKKWKSNYKGFKISIPI